MMKRQLSQNLYLKKWIQLLGWKKMRMKLNKKKNQSSFLKRLTIHILQIYLLQKKKLNNRSHFQIKLTILPSKKHLLVLQKKKVLQQFKNPLYRKKKKKNKWQIKRDWLRLWWEEWRKGLCRRLKKILSSRKERRLLWRKIVKVTKKITIYWRKWRDSKT